MTVTNNKRLNIKKSARIVSDYENDLIFEQPRAGLVQPNPHQRTRMWVDGVKKDCNN